MILSKELIQYLENLIPKREPLVMEMEEYARENHVPIMELVGIEVMLQLLKIIQPPTILEIGTAIGYSAIRMAEVLPNTKIVTIERDMERYEKALFYIEKAGMQNQITVKFGDALFFEEEISSMGPFECIFIDAAKGQYRRFFDIYSKVLTSDGIIISDNVLFKGLVAKEELEKKRLNSMVRKLKDYNEWLMNHPDFETTIHPIGDGIAISRKR